MSRSKALASGNLGKIFGTLLVVGIIGVIVGAVFRAIGGLLGAMVFSSPMPSLLVNSVFQVLGQTIAAPLSAVALVLLYFDLRIRKEGFDLEMMAQNLATPEPTLHVPVAERP
jgi:ABC-type Fe3+ transport system permease subunit